MEIIKIVLPIFLIIWAGFVLRKYDFVELSWVHVLNSFVYYVSLPAIILTSFWQIDWADGKAISLLVLNAFLMILVALLVVVILNLTKINRELKAAIFMVSIVGNTVYMGFPIIGSALGTGDYSAVVAAATIQLVLGLVLSILAVEYWVVRSKNFKTYARDFVRNPLIIALFFGIVLSLIHWEGSIAGIIRKPIDMLAATASPVALFALGAFLHGKFIKAHLKLTMLTSLIKLLLFPIVIWYFSGFFPVSDQARNITALVSCLPVAATCFVIAEKYKLDKSFVVNSILVSTAVSIFTISFFLVIFA
jgi:malonate transporter and related proteins